jgi:hypothetical protein
MTSDHNVTELQDGTPGSEHTAIRLMLASLRYMNQCNAANIKAMMGAHPTFKSRKTTVFPIEDGTALASKISSDCNCNIQRVSGVGDFMIIYTKE